MFKANIDLAKWLEWSRKSGNILPHALECWGEWKMENR
jgi:hypothetical protein